MKGSSVNAVWKTENSILNLDFGSMKILLNENLSKRQSVPLSFTNVRPKNFRQKFHSFYWQNDFTNLLYSEIAK